MKKNLLRNLFLSALLVTISNIVSADVLTGRAQWQRTGSVGRGWNVSDTYRLASNIVLKNEGEVSHLTFHLNAGKYESRQPFRLELHTKAPEISIKVYDVKENAIPFKLEKGGSTVEVSAGELEFQKIEGFGLQIASGTSPARIELQTPASMPLERVNISYALAGSSDHIDIAPQIAAPKVQPVKIAPQVAVQAQGFTLKNSVLTAEFSTTQGLQLKSLRNEYAGKNILIDPAQTKLFITEINGKRFGAGDWQVRKVSPAPGNAVTVELAQPQQKLSAQFKIALEGEGLKFGLQINNDAPQQQQWKAVFPQIGGLAISPQSEDDYYLYPMYGGLVQKINTSLRMYYGAGNESLWQMFDLFSPELGTGMSLRSLDAEGTLKGMAFRKGATPPAYATMTSTFLKDRTAPGYLWDSSLQPGNGASMGFEYSTYERATGQKVAYPEAVIEMHPGDWRQAMRTYSDWAHKAWQWRPLQTKLNDVWRIDYLNIKPTNVNTRLLFSNGKWHDFTRDNTDMGEWDAWWQWGEVGPFGISLDNLRKEAGDTAFSRLRYRVIPDPVTGKPVYIQNFGETNRYNTSMGGLPGLRAAVEKSQQTGILVQLYTAPMLADTSTSMGQYGPKHGVINPHFPTLAAHDMPPAPRDGHVIQYYSYRMDVNSDEFLDIVAQNMARLVKDTGIDAIRLDELGFGGFSCFSTEHKHAFGEPGQHWAMRAMAEMAKRVHKAASAEKPDFVLTAEYPGADIQAAQLDGALTSENRRYTVPGLRPLPVNIFRFYFPEIKLYEYRPNTKESGSKIAFWNAVGTFLDSYPDHLHRVLKENGDAFRSRDAEPLIPTLSSQVYANRFVSGNKQITLFYNAGQKTNSTPLIKAENLPNIHYVDLLSGKELPVKDGAIELSVKPDDVAAIARLSRSMKIKTTTGGWTITLQKSLPDATAALCDAAGNIIEQKNFVKGSAYLDTYGPDTAYVKLFSGKYLVDIIELP